MIKFIRLFMEFNNQVSKPQKIKQSPQTASLGNKSKFKNNIKQKNTQ